jgi:hypothetical protein
MDARILRTFDEPLTPPGGRAYLARIAGRRGPQGRWEGWVEFVPEGGHPVLRSGRETTQSDLPNLERWAQGLSRVYLEGSLDRTLAKEATSDPALAEGPPARPRFEGPAPDLRVGLRPAPDDVALNPMIRYREGEAALRRRIAELPPSELRAIVLAYHFDSAEVDVGTLDRGALEELIVAQAQARAS